MLYKSLRDVKSPCKKCDLEKKQIVDKNCSNLSSSCSDCRCLCSLQICGSICISKSKFRCSLCESHGHVSWWKNWLVNKQ